MLVWCSHVSRLESLVSLGPRRVYGGSWKTCSCGMFQTMKIGEVSYEMLIFLHPRVLSRVSGFLWLRRVYGGSRKPLLFEGFQAACHVVLRGRRGTLWHSNVFDNVSKMSKLEEVSYEMLVFLHPRVLSRVSGFPVASACLWGSRKTSPFRRFPSSLSMSFCVAGVALCDIPTCLITCRKCQNWRKSRTKCSFFCIHVSRLESLDSCGVAVSMGKAPHSSLHTLHSTLYTPHSTLHTPHSTLYTPTLFTFYTPHSTLPQTRLSTPHSTLYTLPSTLHTLHFTLCTHTPHFTLHTPHFTLPHSTLTLRTLHYYTLLNSSLLPPHSTLHIPHSHSTLYTFHSPLHTPHSTRCTPHSTLHTLHSTLSALHFTL